MQYLYNELSSKVNTRSFNVANWPNVSGNFAQVTNPFLTSQKAFQGVNSVTFQDSSSQWLSLVDGGSNQEQIPLGALFAKARAVDVVVAVDASADGPDQWPESVIVTLYKHAN